MYRDELCKLLKQSFNTHFDVQLRRANLWQLYLPLYYPDGDMIDIFVKISDTSNKLILCDCGLTLMHLSYDFIIDTASKENILQGVLNDMGIYNDNDNLWLETTSDMLFFSIMQFAQGLEQVYSMRLLKRENIHNLFYENVDKYVFETFKDYSPIKNYRPIKGKTESADFCLTVKNAKPIFLFAAQGKDKTLRSIISMLTFQNNSIPFTSIVVHDNFSKLGRDDQKSIMDISDKQFYNFDSFAQNGLSYISRIAV